MSDSRATIAIVGAGFSGAMVTAHLLRSLPAEQARVVLINRSGPVARGVAYGTRHSGHVLNVPAGRMSAFPDDEDHFLRFARSVRPDVTGGSFVNRGIYGDYLAWIMEEAAAQPGAPELVTLRDEALAIEPHPDGRATIRLASGALLEAQQVVLALGNYLPANIPLRDRSIYSSPRYVRDPWARGALASVPSDAPVLLIGTGLTMLDVALQLSDASERTAPLIAVSRRGLAPQPHRDHGTPPSYGHLPPDLVAAEPTAVDYLRAVRKHVRRVGAAGVDWREVIASLRPVTPRLWRALPEREQARFLRHLRPYWDVHRHRVAPELFRRFAALRESGALMLMAGRVLSLTPTGNGVAGLVRPRGRDEDMRLELGMVINCTGPDGDVRSLEDPLLAQLRREGLVRPDAHGLGFDVTDDLALIGRDGTRSQLLSLVGPLLRGTWWEATAVPELRVHAARVAARLRAVTTPLVSA